MGLSKEEGISVLFALKEEAGMRAVESRDLVRLGRHFALWLDGLEPCGNGWDIGRSMV